ncbi:hypothetical protein NZK33_08450 [Cyanobium sp. FGCU-6]|nr:hypothetical protein [Cyanobium sp. FGCU6]
MRVSLPCCFPVIIAIVITLLIEGDDGIESPSALDAASLTQRFNVSQAQPAMGAYRNEGNLTCIEQPVEVRPGDVENLGRLLRGEKGIIRNQRDRLSILQMLEHFPQHCVDLYRNILGNAIRPNQLKMAGWLSMNKECAI